MVGASLAGQAAGEQAGTAPTGNPSSYKAPRTEYGDPDLQGVWRYEGATRLERPKSVNGREFYTDAELAAQVKERAARAAGPDLSLPSATQPAGTYNRFWQDTGVAEVPDRRTSLIIGPEGTIPWKPGEREKSEANDAKYGIGPWNHWLELDNGERCITDGLPGSVWTGTAGGPQIVQQSRGYFMMIGEQFRDRRIVPTDGRPHGKIRHVLGEGVGKWEGDTFVIQTRNFQDRTKERWLAWWRIPTETMTLTERFTRVAPDTLLYQLTVDDPSKFTKPFTIEVPLTRLNQPFLEYACHEGNYGIIHTLSGSRAKEKAGTVPQ
jgi:hypothetical protein